ncbi:MAG: hypothetical protein KGR46_06170 [Verrucomicrobia bacterium]|nr:hypothetical protein [Verrucomicrobiota bacterium]
MISLPPIVKCAGNFEADYYGAATLIARKLGITGKTPSTKTDWMHGWLIYKNINYPEYFSPNSKNKSRTILVDTVTTSSKLQEVGYRNTFAVGLPFIYANLDKSPVRTENSLLIMPQHQTTHSKHIDLENLSKFFTINKLRFQSFSKVSICVSGSCSENEEYMSFMHTLGYEIVIGAGIFDRNALLRMKTILSSFTTIATNTIGSHIAYAALCGTKILYLPPFYRPDYDLLAKTEPLYLNFPHLIEAIKQEQTKNPPEKLFPHLFLPNQNIELLKSWGEKELGLQYKKTPKEIARLFKWNLWFERFKRLINDGNYYILRHSLARK